MHQILRTACGGKFLSDKVDIGKVQEIDSVVRCADEFTHWLQITKSALHMNEIVTKAGESNSNATTVDMIGNGTEDGVGVVSGNELTLNEKRSLRKLATNAVDLFVPSADLLARRLLLRPSEKDEKVRLDYAVNALRQFQLR